MTKFYLSPFILALACVCFAAPARSEGVRDAVEAGNRAFITAFLRGDAAAIANLYTESARIIAPGSPIVNGRPSISAFWRSFIESGIKDMTLETGEVESAGDLAYETGTVRLVAEDGAVTTARYVVVWKRIGEEWRLHRDIWNSSE